MSVARHHSDRQGILRWPRSRCAICARFAADPPAERAERGSHVSCIAGALAISEYRAGLVAAGFADVSIDCTHAVGDGVNAAIVQARRTGE